MAVQLARLGILISLIFAALLVAYLWLGQGCTLPYVPESFQGCSTGIIIDTLNLPRPGIKGIRLTTGEDMLFEIDYHKRTRMRPLDWKSLNRFPNAHVEITVKLDTTGRVTEKVYVYAKVSSAAADTIWKALKTWRYKPYKSGLLSFAFNVPGGKISIDTTHLITSNQYSICRVKNNVLYYISNRKDVRVRHH